MSQNVPLRRNQRRALAALLNASTIGEAAQACGLSVKTLQRYLINPEFRKALTAAESDLIDVAGRRLVGGQEAALTALEGLITGAKKDSDRRLAAVAWLDLVLRWRELKNVEERLAGLEAAVYGQQEKAN